MARKIVSQVDIKNPQVFHKNLSKQKIVGLAYRGDDYYIEIDPNQNDREYFLTYFHELMHLLLPDLKERYITKIERKLGLSLWEGVLRLRRKWKK